MANKKKSKTQMSTGTTTMSFIKAGLKYSHFICKDETPSIVYFTDKNNPKILKINNQTEYFKNTMYIEFRLDNKIGVIDIHGNPIKPVKVNKEKSTKTYSIPLVDFLKSVKACIDDEDVTSSSVYAAKETRTNKIYWIWMVALEVGTITTPDKTIYINFEL